VKSPVNWGSNPAGFLARKSLPEFKLQLAAVTPFVTFAFIAAASSQTNKLSPVVDKTFAGSFIFLQPPRAYHKKQVRFMRAFFNLNSRLHN